MQHDVPAPLAQAQSPISRLVLIGYAIWITILTGSYFTLLRIGADTLLPFAWLAIGLSGIAAIIVGIIRYRPLAWKGWVLLATANLLFISGDTFFKVTHYLLGVENPFPSFADVLYLITYPLFALGTYVFIRHRSSAKSDNGAILDAATFTIGLALLVWVYLVIPNATVDDATIAAKITSIAYPLGDVLLWAMLVRLLMIDIRTRAVQLFAVGAFGLIVADIIYGLGQFYGFWHEGSPVDLGWILFYACWGAAALHPSMKVLDHPIAKSPEIHIRRLVLLATTALIAPALLFIEALRGNAAKVAEVVAVFAAALFVLVVLRMFTLVREISNRDAEIALEKQKNEVIEIVSHQLRTPLSIIMLYSEELLRLATDTSRKSITTIHRANQRLIELVNTLVYSTQLDMGTAQFKLAPYDLGAIVREALNNTQALVDEKQLTVALTIAPNMPSLITDKEALRTALGYVINNAARYAQSATTKVAIDIKHEEKEAIITVQDTGVGIPEEDQSEIFSRLFRATNAVSSFPDGVGLGLYMAKAIIEGVGGRIWFTSELGKGSTFYISLPLDNKPSPQADAAPKPPTPENIAAA